METILTFLRDFGYFNAGMLAGGAVVFFFSVLAFSSPLYWQQKDIERLQQKNIDLKERNEDLEALNTSCQKYKAQYQTDYYSELCRANLLEDSNVLLQTIINDEKEKNQKLYVELDALKAQYFPGQSKEVA